MKKKLLISLLFVSTCSMMLPFKFCIFNQTFDDWRVVDISNTDDWDWPGANRPEQLLNTLIQGHTSQCWDFAPNFWANSAPFNARLLSDHDEWVAFRVETYDYPCHSPSQLIFKLKEPTMLPLLCGSTLKLVEAPPQTTTTTTTSTTTIAPSPAPDASLFHFWLLIPVFPLIFLAIGVLFWVKHQKMGAAVERGQFGSREDLLPSMFVPSDPVEGFGADLEEKFISRGSFGEVYELINYSRPAVIKYVRCFTADEVALYQKEFEVLEKLSHSNVVALLGTMKRPGKFGIIMEFCEQGELKRLLHDSRIVYTMRTVVTWSEQLFEAVRYMYREFNLIHRDINPANSIFVTSRFHLKMGDFGLSKCIEQSCSGTFVGTPRYISPPQRNFGDQENNTDELQNSHRNDIFSLGLVLWEMIERRIVFADYGKEHFDRDHFVTDVLNEKPDMLSLPKCPSHFQKIIESCTNFNRRLRPMAAEVLYQINKPIPFDNEFHFEPIIDEEQKRILRPIGFDESVERVPIEEEAESDLGFTLSVIHGVFASETQPIS